jgi:hypothetical protein
MSGLYDLHTHSILSDGEMLPIELIRRMSVLGYSAVAITDHVDTSNAVTVIETLKQVRESAGLYGVRLLCGVEITHVPPAQIAGLARQAKEAGADIVVVHGESPVEPVAAGTNHTACICRDVDVLAHPGLITIEEAQRVLGGDRRGTQVFRECAMEGRKFGVGLCVITQQPKNIDPRVLAQLNTFVVMGLGDRGDRDIIASSAKQDLSRMDTEIQTLEPGEAVISSLRIPFPVSTRIHLFEDYLETLRATAKRPIDEDLAKGF